MLTRWLTGPLQKITPLAQTYGYATDCGGAALFDSPRGGTSPCRGSDQGWPNLLYV